MVGPLDYKNVIEIKYGKIFVDSEHLSSYITNGWQNWMLLR
jgi:hypothetical protein